MVRLPHSISRGERPWFHSTTDHPYLDPAGACDKDTSFFSFSKAFSKKKNIFCKYFHNFFEKYDIYRQHHSTNRQINDNIS